MELPCIVRWIRFPKKENLYNGYHGFVLFSCELDQDSKLYQIEMEDLAEESISEKYGTFTVSMASFLYEESQKPVNMPYVFIGDFVKDAKWGSQFKAEFCYQDIPSNENSLREFLMQLPNIKSERSLAIIKRFGVEGTLEILDKDIYKLTEINGINENRIPPIQKAWETKKCLRSIYHWFSTKQLSIGLAEKAFKMWGNDTIKLLEENPYRLVDIYGVGFIRADQEAHKITANIPDEFRTKACIQYILKDVLYKNSDLCILYSDLKENILNTINECDNNLDIKTDLKKYLELIPLVIKKNLDIFTVVKDVSGDTADVNKTYVYMKDVWEKEHFIAKTIYERKSFNQDVNNCSDFDIENAEKNATEFNNKSIKLDETQKDAIKSAFNNKLTVITGSGGTGKSMICRCIYYLAQKRGLRVRMMTPTGKAAQVLKEKTGCEAATIHRSLKMRPNDEKPREIITEDIVLIDEVSMCGLDTMFAIAQAISSNLWANIVLVGDKNQLPSVSPGNFLSDIMASGCANVVTLEKIHRQDENSYIPVLASDISKGKIVNIDPTANDIKWINISLSTFYEDIINFTKKYLDTGKSIDDLQFISPMKKGDCGVFKINTLLQNYMSKINNQDKKVIFNNNIFYIGDKIMQIENNYDKMLFNGDIGTITDLGEKVFNPSVSDRKEKYITVDFYGEEYKYVENELEQLQLAWVLTAHKMQGSQVPYVVCIMANEAKVMMSRELIYTVFTRPEKELYIFGNDNMLKYAATRSVIKKRNTNLVKIIEDLKGNKKVLKIMSK